MCCFFLLYILIIEFVDTVKLRCTMSHLYERMLLQVSYEKGFHSCFVV